MNKIEIAPAALAVVSSILSALCVAIIILWRYIVHLHKKNIEHTEKFVSSTMNMASSISKVGDAVEVIGEAFKEHNKEMRELHSEILKSIHK